MEELERVSRLANGERSALELNARLDKEQLGIDVNPEYERGLMCLDPARKPLPVGDLEVTVLGPTREELNKLQQEWDAWLKKHREGVRELQEEMERDAERLATSGNDRFRERVHSFVSALGDRSSVTTPNLASLMLLVEEGRQKVLLTGDGHSDDVVEGLRATGKMPESGTLHVDVLKIPHHGATANVDRGFFKAVTADRYVLCGNGAHDNPELEVLQAICDSRLVAEHRHPKAPETPFELLFTSSEVAANTDERKEHMKKVEAKMKSITEQNARVKATYLGPEDPFLEMGLGAP